MVPAVASQIDKEDPAVATKTYKQRHTIHRVTERAILSCIYLNCFMLQSVCAALLHCFRAAAAAGAAEHYQHYRF